MLFTLNAVALTLALFGGMLACLQAGRWFGTKWWASRAKDAKATAGTLEAAIFALMGLLLAFSFGGASARFDQRRLLVVEEANAIGTAWLRLDLLPANAQPEIRELFRNYLDSRLAAYAKIPDISAAYEELERAQRIQSRIWSAAVAATRDSSHTMAGMLVLPALNAMIDISTTRTMTTRMHPPIIIFILFFGLAYGSMLLAGFDLSTVRTHSWVHVLAFAALLGITVFTILDMEFPRLGLIRVEDFDKVLREVRSAMN